MISYLRKSKRYGEAQEEVPEEQTQDVQVRLQDYPWAEYSDEEFESMQTD